jgi:transposase
MSKQRVYYPRTTYSQRRLLFQVWEEEQNVAEACRQARVAESTFYYWKPRFEAGGYEGLKETKKSGPAKGMCNPKWGKQRIAHELAKKNNWVPLVSANTVRRILQEKGLWAGMGKAGAKKKVAADQPPSGGRPLLCAL